MTSFPLFTLFLSFFSEMCVKLLFPFIFLFPSRHFALATGWIGYFNCSIPFPTRIFRTPGVVGADPKAEAEAETERHKRSCKQKQAEEERWVCMCAIELGMILWSLILLGGWPRETGIQKAKGYFIWGYFAKNEKKKKQNHKTANGEDSFVFYILLERTNIDTLVTSCGLSTTYWLSSVLSSGNILQVLAIVVDSGWFGSR